MLSLKGVWVAVDHDDVMADFTTHMMELMNYDFDTAYEPEVDATEWHWYKSFDWKGHGYKDWWDWMQRHPGQWADTPAIPGALGGVQRLRTLGAKVELLTSKPEWAHWEVFKWLGDNQATFDRVTIVGKEDVKAKWSAARVLVDDKWENVREWAATGRLAVMFTRPWNEGAYVLSTDVPIVRADDWDDVTDVVLEKEWV